MLRLATVFSGIGAIEHALDRMNIEHKIVFACDNGDVKLEMPKIDIDIDAIESELKKLKKKIKSFNSDISDEEYVDYAAQLDTMLAGVEDELNKLREKLKVNENGRATINDAVNETESVLENALEISTASKKKKYKELLKLRNIKASDKAKLFFVLRVALTLDGDGIEYDSKSIKMIVELYNSDIKRLIKAGKDLSERLEMIHDKLFYLDTNETGYESPFPRNRILFGAPGTGKSFTINNDREELLGVDNEDDYERVTFHPDYSYANFVGTYKPVMVDDSADSISLATEKEALTVLTDESISAQEKYDLLYDKFKDGKLTLLPFLLGLFTDDDFKTRKKDGSDTADDNNAERNHGRAIRPYVNLSKPSSGKKDISYEYVPGPFMRMYVKALKNSRTDNIKPFLLIIEEINRANVAAVFGDVFQLLDRGSNFVSEYPIQATEDIKKYLAKELGGKTEDYNKIKIPDNMFIWATMNSADQGVFPMDTAFKRRWDFTYLGIDDNDKELKGRFVTIGSKEKQRIEWNELRKAINEFLAEARINEDKQLGPYFISKSIVIPKDGGTEIDSKLFCDAFKNKVLMYLFDDAAKQKHQSLFEGSAKGYTRYSKICEAFDEQGIGIFNSRIQNAVDVQDLVINEHPVDENRVPISESND